MILSPQQPKNLQNALVGMLADGLEGIRPDSEYAAFQAYYFNAPDEFALDCIRWQTGDGLAEYQIEALVALRDFRRLSVRSLHGAGKTALAAIIVLWFALTRDGLDWKVITTASVWRQLTEYLWPEIHKWARSLRWDVIGRNPMMPTKELLTRSIKLATGSAFAVASSDGTAIEGAHADHLLYLFDEAKAIPDDIWDSAEGAFSGAQASNTYAVCISTPAAPAGRFYRIQKRDVPNWQVFHWSLQQALAAGRTTMEWVNQCKALWGENSALFKNRVLGEFASGDTDGVIPLAWVEMAVARFESAEQPSTAPVSRIGADIGLSSDETVFALIRSDNWCDPLLAYGAEDPKVATMVTAGRLAVLLNRHKDARAQIDAIGIGAGVVHRLHEQGYNRAKAFVASASAKITKKTEVMDMSGSFGFANKRAAAWWGMRERLDPESGENIALPPDDELIGDLTSPKFRLTSGGKLLIESKEAIHKRIGRSTDRGDAVVMGFWQEPEAFWIA